MAISVQAPNGDIIDFPDGTDDATINSAMAKNYGSPPQAAQPSPPTQGAVAGPNGTPPVQPPENQWLGFEHGTDKVIDNAAVLASHIPVIGPLIDNLAGPNNTAEAVRNAHQAYFDAQQNQGHGRPGGAGDFAGTLVAEAPIAVATRNPWIAGGVGGALGTNDPNNPVNVGVDTALGAVGGKALHAGMNFAAGTINPLVRSAVQRMVAAGVPLTPGQIMGGTSQMIENAMRFLPGVGDLVHNAQDRSLTGFNNAAYNEVLSHLPGNVRLPPNVTGHEAATFTQQAISNSYERILPTLKVQYDQPFVNDLMALRSEVDNGSLPADKSSQYFKILRGIATRFSGAGGMTGRTMQEVDSGLGQQYRAFRGSSNPDDQTMATLLLKTQGALRNMVYRANPSRAPELQATRAAFAHFVPVEDAAGAGSTDALGRFQPGQLKNAVVSNDSTVNNRATAQGRAPMQGLSEDAQATMGRSIPTPNPVNRLLMAGGGLLGALAAHLNPVTAIPAGVMAAPYTRVGGNIVREALTGRQGSTARAVGGAIRRMAAPSAVVGGAMVPKRAAPHSAGAPIIDEHPEFFTGGGA